MNGVEDIYANKAAMANAYTKLYVPKPCTLNTVAYPFNDAASFPLKRLLFSRLSFKAKHIKVNTTPSTSKTRIRLASPTHELQHLLQQELQQEQYY